MRSFDKPSDEARMETDQDRLVHGSKLIDYFHYDVTHAKVSGSCSKDCAQGRSIAGKFKIIS